jgi:hypothetical protein
MDCMKTITSLITAIMLAGAPALAADKFPPAALTFDVPKATPPKSKPDKVAPLTEAKSQWSADNSDKPARGFGDVGNDFCGGYKLSVTARQRPLYPNIGPDPSNWEPNDAWSSQCQDIMNR